MSATAIEIRPCRPNDVVSLQGFLDEHWCRGHILARDETLLCWQYSQNRMRRDDFDGPTVMLACERERIVGIQAMIPAAMNLRGEVVSGVWLSNLLSLPEVRNRGVGLKLVWAVQALKLGAVFDLGINQQVKRIFQTMSYEILEDLPRWVAILDVPETVQLIGAAAPDLRAPDVEAYCMGFTPTADRHEPPGNGVAVSPLKGRFGRAWDTFWTHCLAPGLVCTNRDAAYLNWRYVDHPSFVYDRLLAVCRASQDIMGLAVFRIEPIPGRRQGVMRVVEFLAAPDAASALARAVLQAAVDRRVAVVDFYCTSARAAAALEEVGFRREHWRPELPPIPTRLQPLEPGHFTMSGAFFLSPDLRRTVGALLTAEDLYVTKADGDMDRPN